MSNIQLLNKKLDKLMKRPVVFFIYECFEC